MLDKVNADLACLRMERAGKPTGMSGHLSLLWLTSGYVLLLAWGQQPVLPLSAPWAKPWVY